MSNTRTLLLAFAFVAVMAEASSRHKHGGLGTAQPGPGLGATRFVCAHCTATGELSSRGLLLNRASVRRHGLTIDSVSALQTDSVHRCALRTESIAHQELEAMSLVDFHNELRMVLTSYNEDFVKMDGPSGVNHWQKVAFKRQIKRLKLPLQPASEAAAAENNGGAADAEVDNTSEPVPPPPEPAAAPAKAAPARAGRRGAV